MSLCQASHSRTFEWISYVRSPRIMARALGSLLLAASILKSYSLLTDPAIERDLLSNSVFLLGVAEFEVFLGFWLWSRFNPLAARFTAMGCFSCFLVASVVQALSGEDSCGCLGPIKAVPWLMVVVDALALLWLTVAEWPQQTQPMARSSPPSLAVVTVLGLVLIIGELIAFLEGQEATLLHPSTAHLDFGCACQGSYHEIVFSLTNPGSSTVQVESVATTCRCLLIVLDQASVSPGEMVRAVARFDLGQEPNYVGKLGVRIYGRTVTGRMAFRMLASAEVTPRELSMP